MLLMIIFICINLFLLYISSWELCLGNETNHDFFSFPSFPWVTCCSHHHCQLLQWKHLCGLHPKWERSTFEVQAWSEWFFQQAFLLGWWWWRLLQMGCCCLQQLHWPCPWAAPWKSFQQLLIRCWIWSLWEVNVAW